MPERTVLLVVPAMDVGGAQESALSLARNLPAVGWGAAAVTFADGPMRADFEAAGVPVDVLADRRHRAIALPWFLADMVRMRRALVAAVRMHGADVVQIQMLGTLAFLVMTLRAGQHADVVWRIANVTLPGAGDPGAGAALKRAAHRVLYRVGARAVDGVVAVSEEVAEAFVRDTGAPRNRVRVMLNGVDTARYPASGDRGAVRASLGFDAFVAAPGVRREPQGAEGSPVPGGGGGEGAAGDARRARAAGGRRSVAAGAGAADRRGRPRGPRAPAGRATRRGVPAARRRRVRAALALGGVLGGARRGDGERVARDRDRGERDHAGAAGRGQRVARSAGGRRGARRCDGDAAGRPRGGVAARPCRARPGRRRLQRGGAGRAVRGAVRGASAPTVGQTR